ncbi:MAG: hypothetical protein AAFX85_17505 [Pseudomonadota bacterium]
MPDLEERKTMRSLQAGILGLALMLLLPAANAEPKIMITSYANDFEFVNGNIGCPKGDWGNAFVVGFVKLIDKLPARDAEELMRLIDNFERRHGVLVQSRTRSEDFEITEDKIRTETTGPVDEAGAALCSHIAGFLPLS